MILEAHSLYPLPRASLSLVRRRPLANQTHRREILPPYGGNSKATDSGKFHLSARVLFVDC